MSGATHADAPAGHDEIAVPARIVVPLILLILFAILAVGVGRAEQVGVTHEGRLDAVHAVRFRFEGVGPTVLRDSDPLVAVTADGRRVVLAARDEEIFPRLILRSIANIRARDGIDEALPLSLVVAPGGQRLLVDPASHTTMRLAAFGPDNGHALDAILPPGDRS